MRKPTIFAAGLLLAVAAQAATVDEIVAKHIDAKGGRDNWQKIESMRLSGEFTAFSKVSPFTLHRQRANRYLLSHEMNEHRLVVGHDGDTAWWDNEFGASGGPQPITGEADLAALTREIEFATPFFDYKNRGFEVTLVEDKTEFEGIPAIALELKRPDDSVETWYLDPETYLELGRESPGSDFGRPMPSRTFFDEFREVGGVMIPHYVETQWYTRDRVMNVASVELNVDLPEGFFSMPVATGMELFQKMIGDWEVKVESKQSPRQPEFTESSRMATITAALNGGLVQERYKTERGVEALRSLSYDRYRDRYVLTQMNDVQTFLDIQVGKLEDDTLTVSNIPTDTSMEIFGGTLHERSRISNLSDGGFTLERENSMDGGENWALMQRLTYTRAGNGSEAASAEP